MGAVSVRADRWRARLCPPATGTREPVTVTEDPRVELDRWSIVSGYADVAGVWHPTAPATRAALRAAMGADEWASPPPPPPFWMVEAGNAPRLVSACDLFLEDGTLLTGLTALPPDLPLGYHVLRPLDGGPATRLVVVPRTAPRPGRAWGWAVQLYAARSRTSWGIGDLADLRRLGRWSRDLGAGVLILNPLHAPAPTLPQEPSPYFASSRLYRNPLYLRPEELPGVEAAGLGTELGRLAAAGHALNTRRHIERDEVLRLKLAALEHLFGWFETSAPDDERLAFERYRSREGRALRRFAVHSTLAERFGPGWRGWPAGYRHPRSAEVTAFAQEHATRVRFHEWVQWQLDRQLAAASRAIPLVGDLAVGFDAGGADGWAFQDSLALDCRIGAPPDGFNPAGQDWGLPPFVPWKLRHAHYEPFLATLRAAFRHMAGIRIDHVMGLFRLYWIPDGATPTGGTYVHYRADELLGLVALEATRAGAFVVGEDLGTVEEGVRARLDATGILSYRLLWFEEGPPRRFPTSALAAVTTHDLPTIAGVWTGADAQAQRDLGREGADESDALLRARLQETTGLPATAGVPEVVLATHRALAEAPSLVLAATLEDALGVTERPNMPGTVDEWPNWRLALPEPLEEIERHPLVLAVARALGGDGEDPSAAAG